MNYSVFKYFLHFIKKYWVKEVFLILLILLTSIGSLASPYILKIIIDQVFPSGDFSYLLFVLVIYLGIVMLRIAITFIHTYLFEWISNHLVKDIRKSFFSHLIRLPLAFFDKNKTGDVLQLITSEINSIQNFLTGSLVRIISSVCTIFGLVVMLGLLNFKLFLISMCVFPFIFINTRFFQPKIQRTIKKSRIKDADILSYLVESMTNIKLIKSYMNYRNEEERLDEKIDEQIRLNLKSVKLSSLTRNITLFFSASVPVIILGMGGKNVMEGTMTVGALVAFIQYMNRLFDPFRDLMGLYFDMIRTSVSMERILEIYKNAPESAEGAAVTGFLPDYRFELRNVSFDYGSHPVLQNVDISFQAGKKYALVGSSGSGKSTIINLLCRFYEIGEGQITLGGTDIRRFSLDSLRNHINLVTQDNHIFHDTVRNNITYGTTDISETDLMTATRVACIDKDIQKMENGYDTVIGDRGSTLSGGQRQRLSISRCLLKSGQIIILDEATSAIDSETEREIMDKLFEVYHDKTVIVVSHRLSAIKNVDEILCFDKGAIVEKGTHEELLEKQGFYYSLFREQLI